VESIRKEHSFTDPDFTFEVTKTEAKERMVEMEFQSLFLRALAACPNGIYRMTPEISSLVQSSNNLARVFVGSGKFEAMCLTRSSIESEKLDLVDAITSSFELMGASVEATGAYPGWQPKPQSEIVKLMKSIYENRFEEQAHVQRQKPFQAWHIELDSTF